MEYLLRDQLNQFIGKEMRVLCVNEGILRTGECAYFIAEDDESAGKYFEEIKKDLPENNLSGRQFIVRERPVHRNHSIQYFVLTIIN